MTQDQRSLVAVALSTVVLIGWFVLSKPTPSDISDKPDKSDEQAATTTPPPITPVAIPITNDAQGSLPIVTTTVSTPLYEAAVSSDGATLTSWGLREYQEDSSDARVDLAKTTKGLPPPLALTFQGANFSLPESPRYQLVSERDGELKFVWRSSEVEIVKTLTFQRDRYAVDVTVDIRNLTNRTLEEKPRLSWSGLTLPGKHGGIMSFLKQPPATNKQPIYYVDGKVERERDVAGLPASVEHTGALYWAGVEDRYFIAAIIPRVQESGLAAWIGSANATDQEPGARGVAGGVTLSRAVIPPGERVTHAFTVYAGPKEIDGLREMGLRLEEALDYGWFSMVAFPILYLLKFFYGLIHNYGVAIILLTLFIKLLLHPINKKSMKSMKAMQKLQPEIKKLQEKFKADRNRLNQEMMLLFRRHKVNPMGGCLPMLLQFPIYIALYKVLWNSIELYR
ncbi:MAG: membrane protein insertase YidC, partial [Deltaproteobacteria bacterium]|nr:membrane protein insertase YidC [Deltaproteobacteria bacterium]